MSYNWWCFPPVSLTGWCRKIRLSSCANSCAWANNGMLAWANDCIEPLKFRIGQKWLISTLQWLIDGQLMVDNFTSWFVGMPSGLEIGHYLTLLSFCFQDCKAGWFQWFYTVYYSIWFCYSLQPHHDLGCFRAGGILRDECPMTLNGWKNISPNLGLSKVVQLFPNHMAICIIPTCSQQLVK